MKKSLRAQARSEREETNKRKKNTKAEYEIMQV